MNRLVGDLDRAIVLLHSWREIYGGSTFRKGRPVDAKLDAETDVFLAEMSGIFCYASPEQQRAEDDSADDQRGEG